MTKVDLSLVKGAPAGYSGPPTRAYERDPNTPYYEDERAGIDYYEYNGQKGLTKEAYDARVAAKEKSNAFKKQIQDGINSRPAPETPAPEEEGGGGNAPIIDVVDQTVDATNTQVVGGGKGKGKGNGGSGSGGDGTGGGNGGGTSYDGSFTAKKIKQNVGKVGDMTTNITDSEIGENAEIGNDKSETYGENYAGNEKPKGLKFSAFDDVDASFNVGKLFQNVGKEGDMTTNITGSTIGAGAQIGNDWSETYGFNQAGNRSSARERAKSWGFSGNGELTFS